VLRPQVFEEPFHHLGGLLVPGLVAGPHRVGKQPGQHKRRGNGDRKHAPFLPERKVLDREASSGSPARPFRCCFNTGWHALKGRGLHALSGRATPSPVQPTRCREKRDAAISDPSTSPATVPSAATQSCMPTRYPSSAPNSAKPSTSSNRPSRW